MPIPEKTVPIERVTARDSALNQIRTWIEDGILEPGEILRDTELAERLGVSRTPVREALQILEQMGVVETVAGRRTRVTPIDWSHVELVQLPLSVLHAAAADVAAKTIDVASIDALRGFNDELLAASKRGNPEEARAADRAFHHLIADAAANPFILMALDQLEIHSRRLDTLRFKNVGPAQESYEQHRAIVDALETRDGAAAARWTRLNILNPSRPEHS